jgi:hypothetical protein
VETPSRAAEGLDRHAGSWVWLGSDVVDFGGAIPGEDGDERIVWLYADPYGALEAPRAAGPVEVRRAYWRLARMYHPDAEAGGAEGSRERFASINAALGAVRNEGEVAVEPISGDWWRFVGFERPDSPLREAMAVTGLVFELRDLRRVPLAGAEDELRVSYAGQSLELKVAYTESASAQPVRRARAATVAESTILFLICALLVPVAALLLAVDVYVLSNTSALLFWASLALVLALGYGALAGAFRAAGRPVPTPRRAVLRTRASLRRLRALPRRTGDTHRT